MTMTADAHRDKIFEVFALGREFHAFTGDAEKQNEIFREVEKTINSIVSEFDW